MLFSGLVFLLALATTYCTMKNKLALWIDEEQVQSFWGVPYRVDIIANGEVVGLLQQPNFEDIIPVIPPEVDSVNLTWQAGRQKFSYSFDGLHSENTTILYNPLLSIPASGSIPERRTIFQISLPCTGRATGKTALVLGMKVLDVYMRPIKGSPIRLKLKKKCAAVAKAPCKFACNNGGYCDQLGECVCTSGFQGRLCEVALCPNGCENNGTCVSRDFCSCPHGFSGKRCEIAMCRPPCQHGGRCIKPGFCWCSVGFYGEACQISYCISPCKNGGICVGPNVCRCPAGYQGNLCDKGLHNKAMRDADRNRRSNKKRRRQRKRKRRNRSKRIRNLRKQSKPTQRRKLKSNKGNLSEALRKARRLRRRRERKNRAKAAHKTRAGRTKRRKPRLFV